MYIRFHFVLGILPSIVSALGVSVPAMAGAPTPAPIALPSTVPSPAVTSTPTMRHILVLNEGNEAIFNLRIGQPGGNGSEVWSDDLLSFDRVIDVSEAQELDIALDPSTCRYDVEAVYRDGHIVMRHGIDVCHVQRITFTH